MADDLSWIGFWLFVILLNALVCAFLCSALAKHKGDPNGTSGGAFLAGLFFWEIALLYYIGMPDFMLRRQLEEMSRAFVAQSSTITTGETSYKISSHEITAKVLRERLRDRNDEVRYQALHAIANIKNPPFIPELIECTNDSAWYIRLLAVKILGSLEYASGDVINALEARLKDRDKEVMKAARDAINNVIRE